MTDELSTEEPLEVRVGGEAVTVTMRTPGADFDLVAGFLVTEGIIGSAAEIAAMKRCAHATDSAGEFNVVDVRLRAPRDPDVVPRRFYTTSSCGLCGRASIDAVRTRSRFEVAGDPLTVTPALLAGLPETLRREQRAFARTGGLHAAALFDSEGRAQCVREDVGRHNAFDKVIGWAATQQRLPLTGCILLASGRASFELVQKALMAGVPMICAVSAPSSLAVELAADAGMTLVGFLRGERMNVYTGHQRVIASA